MPPVCPNGSAPQTGVAAEYIIDNAFMRSLLPVELEWLGQFLPYIIPLRFSTALFCADDPPGFPDTSAVEWAALIAGSPAQAAQESGRQVAQFLYNILWYRLCECLVDSTPAIGTGPSEPADLPAINPPELVTRPLAEPCATEEYTSVLFCGGNNGGLTFGLPIAGNQVTAVRLTITDYNYSGANFTGNFDFNWYSSTALLRSDRFLLPPVGTGSTRVFNIPPPPAGAVQGQVVVVGTGSGCRQFDTVVEYFCDGAVPGGEVSPCCPPDPDQLAMLQRILQMVTLVQRQAAPFAYVYGDNHEDLSGDGSISVSGLLGVSVDVTTLPDELGRSDGTPEQLFDVGYITLGTADGWSTSRRIDHDGILMLPPAAGAFTSIGYTLTPGVVVAIRELVAEP
jgi:hypothetical protein